MRIGIVSDVHSNLPALQAVLADMGTVDELWCLGDTVGYGPFPNECLDELRSRNFVAVPGNHDWGAVSKMPLTDFNSDARWACEWSRGVLTPEHTQYLEGLEKTRTIGDFTLVHGTPQEPLWEYMAYATVARLNFHYFTTRFCLVGHTHVPLVFVDHAQQPETLHPGPLAPLQLGTTRAIINPGSVGQPRDGNPLSSYALLDTDEALVEFRRVEYDVSVIQGRMRELKFPERLIKRLAYGW